MCHIGLLQRPEAILLFLLQSLPAVPSHPQSHYAILVLLGVAVIHLRTVSPVAKLGSTGLRGCIRFQVWFLVVLRLGGPGEVGPLPTGTPLLYSHNLARLQ